MSTGGKQMRLNDEELQALKGAFASNDKLIKTLRKIFLPEIDVDSEAIASVIFNLLDNAIKYSGDSKRLELETYSQNNEIIVKVSDHGLGIPISERKRIFEKFYRVEDPLIHNTKGSGLGLNMVFEIMKDHEGRVEVESKVGDGSTFKLVFPVNKQQNE